MNMTKPAGGGGPKQVAMDDAKELCYFAVAAIQVRHGVRCLLVRPTLISVPPTNYPQHKETALAIDRLEKALQKLRSIS